MGKLKGYQITDQYVIVNYSGQTHMVRRSEALAEKLVQALRDGKEEEIPNLITVSKRIETASKGNFVVKNGKVFVNGIEAPKFLGDKIFRFSNEGLPFQPLVKFAEKLQKNPSFRAVNELFQFLEKNNHPITPEGNFIAYKKVRGDFKDAYTGTFDNSPGQVVEMPRNQVNEDANQTCSHGLHVANWDYAKNIYSAGSDAKMLEVEIDPADVVAVPVDYNQAKMRVCKYVVLGEVDSEHSSDTLIRTTKSDTSSCNATDCDCEEDDELDYEYGEDDRTYCEDCGDETDGYDLCDECYKHAYEEEEEEEEDDEYPWDDELND